MAPLVESVSKMFIKPSSPTPQSLSRHSLSSTDQMMASVYGCFAFFYINPGYEILTVRHQLQSSLSKILAHYYPFAGRLVENNYINCNDQGVEFVEVQIHCSVYDILKNTQSDATDLVFPRGLVASTEDSLVAVQLSHFDCGGLAIALCISHKVADGCSLLVFMKDWAASTSLSSHVPTPLFVADSVFPGRGLILSEGYVRFQNCVAKRFVFPAAEIEKFKLEAVESGIEQPTRVEVVIALLFHCATVATRSTVGGLSRPSVLLPTINLRPLLALPQNAVGNIFSIYVSIDEDDRIGFPDLIGELRKAKLKFQNLPQEKLSYKSQIEELGQCLKQLNTTSFDVYLCSSLCGFPLYDVDFGWGKPVRTSFLQSGAIEAITLIDSPGNGVEALVTLEERKMSAFEKDAKLLPFASVDSAKWKSKI